MNDKIQIILTSVLASGGFWAFAQTVYTKWSNRDEKTREIVRDEIKDIKTATDTIPSISTAVMGTKHKELIEDCKLYLDRGYITPEELADLHEYTYDPYKNLGGNGTGEKMMREVEALPSTQKNA